MIPFIEKTWFLWWVLSNVIAVRWFHILSVRVKLESPEAQDSATEEKSDYSVWQLLQHAQPVSLTEANDVS